MGGSLLCTSANAAALNESQHRPARLQEACAKCRRRSPSRSAVNRPSWRRTMSRSAWRTQLRIDCAAHSNSRSSSPGAWFRGCPERCSRRFVSGLLAFVSSSTTRVHDGPDTSLLQSALSVQLVLTANTAAFRCRFRADLRSGSPENQLGSSGTRWPATFLRICASRPLPHAVGSGTPPAADRRQGNLACRRVAAGPSCRTFAP